MRGSVRKPRTPGGSWGREHLGISVEDVAERSGLTLDEVELVEDNAVDCPFDVLSRYGKAVGLQFDLRPVSAA